MDNLMKKTLPFIVKAQVLLANRKATKGQGVIEYAGALVVAAVMVAAVLAIGPTGIKTLFTNILTSVQTYMTGQLPK
jgi:Flp pilus assembly pilin Flp